MRKFISIVCTLLISMGAFASNDWKVNYEAGRNQSLVLDFKVQQPELQNVSYDGVNYTKINFDGGVLLNKKGYAALPFVHASLKVEDLKNYTVKVISSDYTDLNTDYLMLPSKGALTRAVNPAEIPYEVAKESMVNAFYPKEIAHQSEPFILRDHRGINVYVNPFQYNTVTKTLRVYNNIRVALIPNDEKPANPLNKKLSKVNGMDALYKSVFINQNAVKTTDNIDVGENGSILVITTARDEDAIAPYIAWKREKGIKVYKEVVATGTNVKNNVKTQFDAHNDILYVLVVGDWEDIKSDANGVTPGSPMDPMMGCVVGTDKYPDISVGRFSANNPAMVTAQVNKVIAYERDADGDSFCGALGVASEEGPGDDNEIDFDHQNVIWESKLEPFTFERYTSNYEPSATKQKIVDAINQGIGIINYTGHGSQSSWGTSGYSISDVNNLDNAGKLPYIISVACNNGDFHKPGGCFAEAWAQKENGGAIAILAATISQPWQPPMRGQDYFNDLLTGGYDYNTQPGNGTSTDEGRTTFGSLVTNSLVLMYKESNANEDLKTIETWTTFGDPSVQVRTAAPKEATLSNENLFVGQQFTTTVSAEGAPVANALVSLCTNDEMVSGYTNENGEVTIENPFVGSDIKLTVTGFNLKTKQLNLTSLPLNGPAIIVKGLAVNGGVDVTPASTLELDLNVENLGTETANGATSTITCTTGNATIITGSADLGNVTVNQNKNIEKAFKVKIDNNVINGDLITFEITSGVEGHMITARKSINVKAANLVVTDNLIVQNSQGEIALLEDGMNGRIAFKLSNDGALDASGIQASISVSDDRISFSNAQQNINDIAVGGEEEKYFEFTINNIPEIAVPVRFTLTVNYGVQKYTKELTTSINTLIEDFKTGDFTAFPWMHSGNADWSVVSASTTSGYAAKSGDIEDNQKSTLKLTHECVIDDEITFDFKVSSEDQYDFLVFYIDNQEAGKWCGEKGWETVTFPVEAGTHTFKWEFNKDVMYDGGSDCAWITNILIPCKQVIPVGLNEQNTVDNQLNAYPNPFETDLRIQFNLQQRGNVTVGIFDIQGQKVGQVEKTNLPAGMNTIHINANDLNMKSGVYFYQMNLDDKTISKKIIKM